jgi:tetratricopeptide (TPR) repeat protein
MEEFLRRQATLKRRVEAMVKASSQSLERLREDIQEAETCLELLAEFDNSQVAPIYQMLAENRRMDGLPCAPPSEMKVEAWNMLKIARLTLAEALEAKESYEEALPLYHLLVEQNTRMRLEVWEDASQLYPLINNLGLCYKRCGKYDEALDWYRKGLKIVEQEDPGSDVENLFRHNLHVMLDGNKAGPPQPIQAANNNSSKSWKACWTCGARENDGSGTELLRCAKCKESKIATPAYYCSKDCQKKDWKRHKQYHRSIQEKKDNATAGGFSRLTKEAEDALNDMTYEPETDYDKLILTACRYNSEGNYKRERRSLEKAIKLQPELPIAHHNLAIVHCSSKNYKQAIDGYLETMRLVEATENPSADDDMFWGRSAASVFSMLSRFSECALIPKPDWMHDSSKLIEIAMRAAGAVPDYNETWGMLGSALEPSDPLRAADCYNKAAQVSEGEGNRQRFRGSAQRCVNLAAAN